MEEIYFLEILLMVVHSLYDQNFGRNKPANHHQISFFKDAYHAFATVIF